jgi:hypothetical protein
VVLVFATIALAADPVEPEVVEVWGDRFAR